MSKHSSGRKTQRIVRAPAMKSARMRKRMASCKFSRGVPPRGRGG